MPTLQQLLNTIDTTYRNAYTVEQKVEWLDTTQRQIFQVIPKESIPFEIITQSQVAYYALPEDCDRQSIKSITIETKPGSKEYTELDYISSSSNQTITKDTPFYTLLDGMMMINPVPDVDTAGKNVLILYTYRPQKLVHTDLSQVPELEEDFHELLVLGTLERIARARGEIEDKNNFASDYNVLLRSYEKLYGYTQPEYKRVNDVLPKRKGRRGIRQSIWAR